MDFSVPSLRQCRAALWRTAGGLAMLAVAGAAGADAAPAEGDGPAEGLFEQQKLTGDWGGLRKSLEDAGITFALSEQSEAWANLRGGIRTGVAVNGLATPSLALDLDKLLHWKGASFFVNVYQIHGVGPSTALVGGGDQQFISGIEAIPSTKLYQLWIEQALFGDRVTIRVGQDGADDELMISPAAQLFLNATFGFPDLLTEDLPSGGPTYPLATPMIRTKISVTNEITFVNAIFNGDPAGPGPEDPQVRDWSGTAFRLSDPPLIFNELWYQRGEDGKSGALPGIYKLGALVHTGRFNDIMRDANGLPLASPLSSGVGALHNGNYAVYALADQMIWKKPSSKDQGITVFGFVMGAPSDRNREDFYARGGFNWKGALAGRPEDTWGLAFAYAKTSGALRKFGEESIALTGSGKHFPSNETVIEFTYLYQAAPWWAIQPDVQYIINPGASHVPEGVGIARHLKDSLTVGVRSKIDF